ncbi:MAG: ABC transporter ATP-binding protein [Candidatus Malihini olakiniferum]
MIYALELEKLTKTYSGGIKAVCGIDLCVEDGDFYALLGPNGAGKSTIIGIISSLVNKSSGKVRVFGYNLERDIVNAKRQLGLVPQEFNFNPFETVLQIVTHQAGYYGILRQVAVKRAEKYLTKLDLWEKRQEKARMLSGGMKRRLMIARALMHEPKLLILDEPTAGVDIELRRSMWGFLKSLNANGTTIILTTHYLEEAEMLCRNVGIIQHGKLVENSSIKALLAKVKSETFILDLAQKSPRPKLDGYTYRLMNTSTLEVDVMREHGLNGVFSQLSAQGIQILSMRNKANRLEELFFSMITGEKMKSTCNKVGKKNDAIILGRSEKHLD